MNDPLSVERWRPIPDAKGYEISTRRRVRSLRRPGPPHVMAIYEYAGRRVVVLYRRRRDLDLLMHQVWGAPYTPKATALQKWHRVMLTEQRHRDMLEILRAAPHPSAHALIHAVTAARHVIWTDPIHPNEVRDPCGD